MRRLLAMAAYKTHRAIRHSRRVSSETGVAITAEREELERG
jgi:hypothetical protein